jgi:hypothetical protein
VEVKTLVEFQTSIFSLAHHLGPARRSFISLAAGMAAWFLIVCCAHGQTARTTADVVVYGGTPAGLAAASAAVREGVSVIVVEPTSHIGGMVTGGIAVTDTGTPHLVGGLAGQFFDEAAAQTANTAGHRQTPCILFHGDELPWRKPAKWDLEPKTARLVFQRWVRQGGYQLLTRNKVLRVQKRDAWIRSITLSDGTILSGSVFIDASYEGDLMARAGVAYTYGRESADTYGEKLAGVRSPHFVKNYSEETYRTPGLEYMHHGQFGADIPARDEKGRLLWGIEETANAPVGAADKRVQAYCFRLIATQRKDLIVPWPKPHRYYPERYELLLRYIQAHPGICFARLVHLGAIPNGKFDLNASGPFSIDYVGGNLGYPEAAYEACERMLQDHEDYEKGFLWFLAHDPRVPLKLSEEVNSWGLSKDEFSDTEYWPVQLYIRESRRMVGRYVMTEHDVLRNKTKEDSVGMGSFVLDSHWVRRFVNAEGHVRVEGHLDESVNLAANPYEIPYRSLTPQTKQCRNLLVPVCLSASHVAICTIRMEPVYMVLGHSAGVAAAMASKSGKGVQDVDVSVLLEKLTAQRQVLHRPGRQR